MKRKKLTAALAAVLVVTAMGSVAVAKTAGSRPSKATPLETTAVDTDQLQQGDQTTPDTASTTTSASTGESTGEATGETGGETGESDGPGGHEDPAGSVDHRFDGNE